MNHGPVTRRHRDNRKGEMRKGGRQGAQEAGERREEVDGVG